MFQFMSEYLWQTGSKDAVVCIVSKYEGDSIIQTSNHISVSGLAQIRIPANQDNKLKEMQGFIYLSDGMDDSDTRKMMFISQIQLIRFHNKQIQNNDTIQTATPPKDSLQRGNNPRGPMPDTLRRRTIGGGTGQQPISTKGRTGLHPMEARPSNSKK